MKHLLPIWLSTQSWKKLIIREKVLIISFLIAMLFIFFKKSWLAHPLQQTNLLLVFIGLFFAIFCCAFAVVRHAAALAVLLKEPFGTLVLTLSVVAIEITMVSSVMLTGADNPTLARDTMYAVIMIVLNGLVGITLLMGGWRYREQQLNLNGSKAFLSVILLIVVMGLILPNYTRSTVDPTLSPFLSIFLVISSLTIYGIFLAIQTVRHRLYFIEVGDIKKLTTNHGHTVHYPAMLHIAFLIAYLVLVVYFAEIIAVPIDYGIAKLKAPAAFGGFVVATLILAPEAMSAIRASLSNQLQRCMNILLGSVLATIGLTIPAVIMVGILTGKVVILGLASIDTVILMLTLLMSILTFGNTRTNVLQGAIHLLLFFMYIVLIFD